MAFDEVNGKVVAAPLTGWDIAAFPPDGVVLLRVEGITEDSNAPVALQLAMDPTLARRMAKQLEKAARDTEAGGG